MKEVDTSGDVYGVEVSSSEDSGEVVALSDLRSLFPDVTVLEVVDCSPIHAEGDEVPCNCPHSGFRHGLRHPSQFSQQWFPSRAKKSYPILRVTQGPKSGTFWISTRTSSSIPIQSTVVSKRGKEKLPDPELVIL